MQEGSRLLLCAVLLTASFSGFEMPPGADSDRPDTRFRKRLDPSHPPSGYYDSASPPLRRQVLGGLASARKELACLWRR
jgi:hypothetical protein